MLRLTAGEDSIGAGAPEPRSAARLALLPRAGLDSLKTYREALETLRAGRPQVALAGFRHFLDANPRHDYSDNAQYWIGECHYDARDLAAAERAFRRVVERYPRGNKVPDAMLKLGFTLQMMGDEAGGRAVLESLARAFPKHEAARLASARLAHPEPTSTRLEAVPVLGAILPVPTVVRAAAVEPRSAARGSQR